MSQSDLTLADRIWICPLCGGAVDRDLNAALNIRDEALRVIGLPVLARSAWKSPVDAA
jgi:transposase